MSIILDKNIKSNKLKKKICKQIYTTTVSIKTFGSSSYDYVAINCGHTKRIADKSSIDDLFYGGFSGNMENTQLIFYYDTMYEPDKFDFSALPDICTPYRKIRELNSATEDVLFAYDKTAKPLYNELTKSTYINFDSLFKFTDYKSGLPRCMRVAEAVISLDHCANFDLTTLYELREIDIDNKKILVLEF
jgi:hypothetical protein